MSKYSAENTSHKNASINLPSILLIVIGITINVLLSFILTKQGLPFVFDTIGTIAVSAITGVLFSGIITAVITNIICSIFYDTALYLAIFHAGIAIITVWFIKKYSFKTIGKTLIFAVILSFLSAFILSTVQVVLFGSEQESLIAQNSRAFSAASGLPYYPSFLFENLLIQFLDKCFSCVLVSILLYFIPSAKLSVFSAKAWKQRPLSEKEIKQINSWRRELKHSMRIRTTNVIIATAVMIVVVMSWTGLSLFYNASKEDSIQKGKKLAKIAASVIDADNFENYVKNGRSASGYVETEDYLTKLWASSGDVTYLYVIKPEENGVRFIFDVNTIDELNTEPYSPGELVEYEAAFEPYRQDFLDGKEIPVMETRDYWGWLLTIYYPVKNSTGKTVAYVGADISLEYMTSYMRGFILKVLFTMAGIFILIISYALWKTSVYTSYPISSITACVELFAQSGEDQEKLDENVKIIRSLDIHTEDEVEKLYKAICKMTLNQAEQMRDIRHLSDSTAKMQDGLIITMADMVESRDSDTGAHVQKTAAYVKIIVEGLKKKGYYAQKITPKFMSDVVRSAPLHDVGKINIPDGVLNKPGKLTDEEFAIMKTHTTAGKKILENAISTVQGENYLKEARNMAAYHHERWDGKGYPEGLHGEVIPLSARIMAVADVFDALASPRVYKPAFPLEKALAILQEGAGTQFDAKCVEVFMDALPDVKMILKKYSSSI